MNYVTSQDVNELWYKHPPPWTASIMGWILWNTSQSKLLIFQSVSIRFLVTVALVCDRQKTATRKCHCCGQPGHVAHGALDLRNLQKECRKVWSCRLEKPENVKSQTCPIYGHTGWKLSLMANLVKVQNADRNTGRKGCANEITWQSRGYTENWARDGSCCNLIKHWSMFFHVLKIWVILNLKVIGY